jgi:hypothetical protein
VLIRPLARFVSCVCAGMHEAGCGRVMLVCEHPSLLTGWDTCVSEDAAICRIVTKLHSPCRRLDLLLLIRPKCVYDEAVCYMYFVCMFWVELSRL